MEDKFDWQNLDHGIRAILFDLDGVLVDAADWHKEAFNLMLTEHGYEPLTDKEHDIDFDGLSSRKKLAMLVELGRLPDDQSVLDKLHDFKQVKTVELITEKCGPTTRVTDVLVYAKSIGLKIGVVTNCSYPTATMMLDMIGLSDKLDVLVTNTDVEGKIKPHPWPFIKAYFELKLRSRQCLAIDDSMSKGIISAVEAGCRTWHLKKFKDLSVKNLMNILEGLKIQI